MIRHVAVAALILGLTGCAQGPDISGFRDVSAPIAATTRFDAPRLDGTWWVRAEFAQAPTQARQVRYVWNGDGSFDIGPLDGALVRHDVSEGARWRASGGAPEIWLLWVDTGYRTAALGTPDGSFGVILDRSATGGTDRIAAARDIFDWFGYDLTKLQETQR
jgi:apolipoprotein D and lipocalin family protein